MKKMIQFGSTTIEYELLYSERKTLGITVTPEMDVYVNAPTDAITEKIEKILRKRAPWIIKQQKLFLAHFPKLPPKKYVSGETHLYLGRQYRLKVEVGEIESVKLQGRFITVICTKKERVEELLEGWYRSHAEARFMEFCLVWIEKFRQFNVSPTEIQIRKMTKRWGSCTPGGKIILNTELIKAPRGCIEYVILHELCHLIHYNHDKKFFELQSRLMPTWQKWKDRLENLPAISGSFYSKDPVTKIGF